MLSGFKRISHLLRRASHMPAKEILVANIPKETDETAYLKANPDVACAVDSGQFRSGLQHYELFGKAEGRSWGEREGAAAPDADFHAAKASKLKRIEPLLLEEMPCIKTVSLYDFLTEDMRNEFRIIDTDAVSSNNYDGHVLDLIDRHRDGLILDCGAGKRAVYYPNVVNFEIVAYESTDVRGVGEVLPFKANSFDAVVSIAVLEHVKDPFRCAKEIERVLKPGGDLICCVPFLQPYHGYPHHYYNMTHQGLRNLFSDSISVDRIDVYQSVLPIWSLTWIVQSWAAGLTGKTREDFLAMKMGDLLNPPTSFLQAPMVTELSSEKNHELASANVLFGSKRPIE